jgi:hypothetical protein
MALKEEDKGRLPWFTLDARKSIKDLKEEIEIIGDNCVKESKNKNISRLW